MNVKRRAEAQASAAVEEIGSEQVRIMHALAERTVQHVLVTCLADTPWGDAGEILPEILTELDDRRKLLYVTNEAGERYTVPLYDCCVRVRELPHDWPQHHADVG